ncbi:MAG: hypothetical protein LBT01_00775, partial [Spirochaetaceae bacterium]|nr:hypothetical protein [Spirochaetaceae bacterium]
MVASIETGRMVKDSFCLILQTDAAGAALRFSGAKNSEPDYRKWTGIMREVLREYIAERDGGKRSFYI